MPTRPLSWQPIRRRSRCNCFPCEMGTTAACLHHAQVTMEASSAAFAEGATNLCASRLLLRTPRNLQCTNTVEQDGASPPLTL